MIEWWMYKIEFVLSHPLFSLPLSISLSFCFLVSFFAILTILCHATACHYKLIIVYQSELNRDVIIIKTIGKVERASEMGTTVPDRQEKKRDNERPISNWILFVFDSVYLRKLLSVVIVVKNNSTVLSRQLSLL